MTGWEYLDESTHPVISRIRKEIERLALEKHSKRLDLMRNHNTYVIYATELFNCPLEYRFKLITPPDINHLRNTFTGTSIHEFIDNVLKNYDDLETEKSLEKTVIVDGKKVIIKGRVDVYVPETNSIIDWKTSAYISRSKKPLPKPHHIKQVKVYNWMGEFDYAEIIYIDTATGKVRSFTVRDRYTDDDIKTFLRYILRENAYDTRYCPTCRFKNICPYSVSRDVEKITLDNF